MRVEKNKKNKMVIKIINLFDFIYVYKIRFKISLTSFSLEWTAPDYMLLTTTLVAVFCAVLGGFLNTAEKPEKISNFCNLLRAVLGLCLLITPILFYVDVNCHGELDQDWHRFLELPAQDKLGFGMVVVLIVLVISVAQTVKNFIITTYSITSYYVLVMGVRAGFLFYKLDVEVFLLMGVGLIILAVPATRILHGEKKNYSEWRKQLVEVLFGLQLTLMGAYFLGVLFCQPTPCLWLYGNIIFLLFEAALCLGKVLVETTPPGGILWEKVTAALKEIKTLVSPDYIPAFQGGEELAQEPAPEKEAPIANISRMVPLWSVQQGGLRYSFGGPQGGPLWTDEQIVSSLEQDIIKPVVPMSGQLPYHVVANDATQYPRLARLLNVFPPDTLPIQGFIPGGFLWGDMNLNEVPNTPTPWGSLLNFSYPDRMGIFDQIRADNPYLLSGHLRRPGYIVNLTNLAGTKGGFYLSLGFHRQIRFPCYSPANDLEMLNGENYKWINMSLFQLKNYLESDPNLRHFASRLNLRRHMGSYICYGGVGFRRAEHWLDLQPNVPSLCVNGMPFYRFP